jgi:hypothetical protein
VVQSSFFRSVKKGAGRHCTARARRLSTQKKPSAFGE